MRLVLDTNVLLAAFIARGTCADLLEHCIRSHDLITSRELVEELRRVLSGKFGQRPADVRAAITLLERAVEVVVPAALAEPVCRDRDDDVVIATAVAGRAGAIITGDRDLLDLQRVGDTVVVVPRDFWKWDAGQ